MCKIGRTRVTQGGCRTSRATLSRGLFEKLHVQGSSVGEAAQEACNHSMRISHLVHLFCNLLFNCIPLDGIVRAQDIKPIHSIVIEMPEQQPPFQHILVAKVVRCHGAR